MKKTGKVILPALLSLSLLASVPSYPSHLTVRTQKADKLIWSGRSGNFEIQWKTDDLIAVSLLDPARNRFSLAKLVRTAVAKGEGRQVTDQVKRRVELNRKEERFADGNPCTYDRDFKLLSVVGSIVSFEDHYAMTCKDEAHPGGQTRITAIDLARPGSLEYRSTQELTVVLPRSAKVIRLTDLFPESQLLQALISDPYVKDLFADLNPAVVPKRLAELQNLPLFGENKDFLTRFAFHHVENHKVAVRVGMSAPGSCRECLIQIGILLPIPKSLVRSLALANSGKEGFLMKESGRIAGGRKTSFMLKTHN